MATHPADSNAKPHQITGEKKLASTGKKNPTRVKTPSTMEPNPLPRVPFALPRMICNPIQKHAPPARTRRTKGNQFLSAAIRENGKEANRITANGTTTLPMTVQMIPARNAATGNDHFGD